MKQGRQESEESANDQTGKPIHDDLGRGTTHSVVPKLKENQITALQAVLKPQGLSRKYD